MALVGEEFPEEVSVRGGTPLGPLSGSPARQPWLSPEWHRPKAGVWLTRHW